jgi:hypothetical protein
MIARIAVVSVALVAIAWLATGLHASNLEQHANRVGAVTSGKPLGYAQVQRAARLYERARAFNADTRPILLEANLLSFFRRGNVRALALAREVARHEPDNVTAWAIVAGMAARLDPPLAVRARNNIARLSPPVPPAR